METIGRKCIKENHRGDIISCLNDDGSIHCSEYFCLDCVYEDDNMKITREVVRELQ